MSHVGQRYAVMAGIDRSLDSIDDPWLEQIRRSLQSCLDRAPAPMFDDAWRYAITLYPRPEDWQPGTAEFARRQFQTRYEEVMASRAAA